MSKKKKNTKKRSKSSKKLDIKKSNNKKATHKKIKKSKRRLRPVVKIILIIILILNIIAISFLIYKKYNISKNYSKYMITTRNSNLYKKKKFKYIKVGKIYKDNIVTLTKAENNYYKTKEGYYINYINLKKAKKETVEKYNGIPFNINIVLKKNRVIYKEDKKYLKLNKNIELILIEKGEEYYKGIYNDKIVTIKKADIKKEINKKNTDIETIEYIPVLHIDDISEELFNSILEHLKNENYYTMTENDYSLWQKDYKVFPKKTVYIVNEQEELKDLLKKSNIKYTLKKDNKINFIENDAQSEKNKSYWYTINRFTTMDRVKDILNNIKLNEEEYANRIAVLNYHFFNDETTGECNETICLEKEKFEEQMKYLKENNIKSLTMEEYYKWLIGEINLPKNSVLLTVDDGAMGTNTILPDVLDKYNQKATLFLITSFWEKSKYRLGNLELQSHSHSLHDRNFCKDGTCDIKTFVLTKEEIQEDLKKSKNKIGNPIAYCYPFYMYDQKTVEAVKEEFSLAFIGGNRKSTRFDDNYLLPRYVITSDITLSEFIYMVQ